MLEVTAIGLLYFDKIFKYYFHNIKFDEKITIVIIV